MIQLLYVFDPEFLAQILKVDQKGKPLYLKVTVKEGSMIPKDALNST